MYRYFCVFERFANGVVSIPELKFNAIFEVDTPVTGISDIQRLEKRANDQLKKPSNGFCVLTNIARL